MKEGDPVTALYPARGGIRFERARATVSGGRLWAQTDKGWVRPLDAESEGIRWARGHGDDVLAALLLVRSAPR